MTLRSSALWGRRVGRKSGSASAVVVWQFVVAGQQGAGLQAAQQVHQGVEFVQGVGTRRAVVFALPARLAFDDVEAVVGERHHVQFVADGPAAYLAVDLDAAGQVLQRRHCCSMGSPGWVG
jgi:hypothetical protein